MKHHRNVNNHDELILKLNIKLFLHLMKRLLYTIMQTSYTIVCLSSNSTWLFSPEEEMFLDFFPKINNEKLIVIIFNFLGFYDKVFALYIYRTCEKKRKILFTHKKF